MKSYSALVREFSTWQRKELEALFIVLDWAKDYQRRNPDDPVGKEWLNATELAIRIIYDDAFNAVKNRGIAYHSGSDTTEAPPEVISQILDELSKQDSSPFVKIDSPNYYYFGRPSTSSESSGTCSDMINFMYFGPAYRIADSNLGNPSTEDIPFGFQFPQSMHFNFGDKKQETTVNLDNSTSSLASSTQALSGITLSENEQREMFLPFPAMYLVRPAKEEKTPLQIQEPTKSEDSEIFGCSHLDLTKYVNPPLESQNSNPAIEFFRISSGIIPPPKNSDIAKRQCTSPFCLCSSVKAAFKSETNEDSLEEDEYITEEVPIEPYLEVENVDFPKLELPDLLDDTPESYMLLQPFNTPNTTEDTSNESVRNTSFSMSGTPRNSSDDKDLMLLQPFNTPVTSGSSNIDTSLSDSLGMADLGLDEDIASILDSKCSMDNDHEYIRQERLRILFSYERSRLTEQKRNDEKDKKAKKNKNSATSTSKSRYYDSSKDAV